MKLNYSKSLSLSYFLYLSVFYLFTIANTYAQQSQIGQVEALRIQNSFLMHTSQRSTETEAVSIKYTFMYNETGKIWNIVAMDNDSNIWNYHISYTGMITDTKVSGIPGLSLYFDYNKDDTLQDKNGKVEVFLPENRGITASDSQKFDIAVIFHTSQKLTVYGNYESGDRKEVLFSINDKPGYLKYVYPISEAVLCDAMKGLKSGKKESGQAIKVILDNQLADPVLLYGIDQKGYLMKYGILKSGLKTEFDFTTGQYLVFKDVKGTCLGGVLPNMGFDQQFTLQPVNTE